MNNIYMNYLGACALLSRISKYVRDDEDIACIERALEDCAKATNGRLEVIKTSPRGFALEPVRK